MKPGRELRERIAAIVGETVEDLSADAVIVAITRRRSKATETFAVPFGNLHAVRGLAEFVYGQLCDDPPEEDDDDIEEDGETSGADDE